MVTETQHPPRGRPLGSASVDRPDVRYYQAVEHLRSLDIKPTDEAVAAQIGVDRTTVGRWRTYLGIPRQR